MPWRTLILQTLHVMRTRPVIWAFALFASLLSLVTSVVSFSGRSPAAAFPLESVGLYVGLQWLNGYVGALLLAAVVYQVVEDMPWQLSVREALRRAVPLLVLSALFGLWFPVSAVYTTALESVPPDTLISAILGPLYLLIVIGMVVAAVFLPWMIQACIQERLPALGAIRRGWRVALDRLRDIALFMLINSGIYVLVLGGVYVVLVVVQGRPVDIASLAQIFQPFRLVTQGGWVERGVILAATTITGLFSWVFEALMWPQLVQEKGRLPAGLQPAREEV